MKNAKNTTILGIFLKCFTGCYSVRLISVMV